MNFNEVLTLRRAVNFFDPDKNISDTVLKDIVEDAAKAPSSFNLQPWKLVIVRDPEKKARLRNLAFDQPKVTEAPVVFMLLADRTGWKEGNTMFEKCFQNNMSPDLRDWFVDITKALYGGTSDASQAFANKNAALFGMSLMYAATCRGLHTHPMDGFDQKRVRKEFDIPDNYLIPMIIAMGYLKEDVTIKPKSWRSSFEEIVLKEY